MLGTIIISSYENKTRQSIYEGIEELCSVKDNYGWASSGIYCYWSPDSMEVLYVGLAVDLSQRFAQHNRIISAPDNATKRVQIDDYFLAHKKLGFSIMVQSTLSQCITANTPPEVIADLEQFTAQANFSEEYEIEELKRQASQQGYEQITYMESLLLGTHEHLKGSMPSWNKIHGMGYSHADAHFRTGAVLLGALTDTGHNFFVARSNILALAAETMAQPFEEVLHAARINALWLGMDTQTALQKVEDPLNYLQLMRERGYLERIPSMCGKASEE
jgi:hypothetical protein